MAGLLIIAYPVGATTLTFDYNFTFSGTDPGGTPPWLTATFDDQGGSGSVNLTMTAANLTGSEFISKWYFNLNPALNPALLTLSHVSGDTASSISKGVDAFKADGDGYYDLLFSFPTSDNQNRFGAGESSVYTISGISSLTADDFDFTSVPGGGAGVYQAASHVQSIDAACDENSGWIAPGGSTNVPEPLSIILLGLGLVAVAGMGRRLKS